ncbi:probable carboxylesterase 2 [Phalaenopsis equestris]|uniref:probable carboxylesterase 2 n=1 Tax=Phalaenopsis equestris TaxID=78828 RepID=UPI0009E4CD55|nr:probable carboxylesterase 2 [Phalaenopsis equestris]
MAAAVADVVITAASAVEDELEFEIPSYFRYYRSGRVERIAGTDTVPASLDLTTGVDSRDIIIDTSTNISARLYLPTSNSSDQKIPILLYLHGGGFCIESAASPNYHRLLNTLSAAAPLLGISLNYRLAPEHRPPAAYEDAWAAIQWVISLADPWIARFGDLNRLFIAGDSAGGNIVHQLAMRLGAAGLRVKGMALIHPFFWGSEPVGLEPRDREFRDWMNRRWWFTFPGAVGLDDPRWNPTAEGAPSLAGLGCERVLVTVADKDYLKYRGREYYERLKESGWKGVAEFVETPAAGHVFHILDHASEIAVKKVRILADFFGRD